MKKITVAITTFNRWESCFDALKSVTGQNIDGLEIVLVDDGSPHLMPDEVRDFIESNGVTVVRHKRNRGLARARNSAIELATGEHFSFCDDDDQWPVGFGKRLLTAVQSGPKEVGVAIALPYKCAKNCKDFFSTCPRLTCVMRHGYSPPASSQVYKTKLIRQIGGYNTAIKSGVDHDLWISLLKNDPMVAVSWGGTAIIDVGFSNDRMTTVENRRRAEISRSLEIWKPQITEAFDTDFYQHFCRSYQQYLDFTFFSKSLHNGDYLMAFKKILNHRVARKLVEKVLNKAMKRTPCRFFPSHVKSNLPK